jgi:SEC-C motif-containing protein
MGGLIKHFINQEYHFMKKCFCGTDMPFSGCCAPVLKGTLKADSAEILMRSRYSAYVTGAIDYIIETTHTSKRPGLVRTELAAWSKACLWQRLDILDATNTIVEFKAHYRDRRGKNQVHHERSNFVFENDRWYYLDGVFPE